MSFTNNNCIKDIINIHFESPSNTDTSKFMEVLNAFGMNQFVSSSTHRLGGILDAFIALIDSS